MDDLILGLSIRDGFWENIGALHQSHYVRSKGLIESACGVPGRHIHSVQDYVKDQFDLNQDSKPWTDATDSRLIE